jgi:hypothetical protein
MNESLENRRWRLVYRALYVILICVWNTKKATISGGTYLPLIAAELLREVDRDV